mgnify:CR=1 FL=1
MCRCKNILLAMNGSELNSGDERVQKVKDRLQSCFYSVKGKVELIVSSMVTFILDKLYA